MYYVPTPFAPRNIRFNYTPIAILYHISQFLPYKTLLHALYVAHGDILLLIIFMESCCLETASEFIKQKWWAGIN